MTNSSHFQIKPPQEIDFHSKLLEQFADMATNLGKEEIIEGQTVEKKRKQQESQQQRKMRLG